jgi:hypothetical protein
VGVGGAWRLDPTGVARLLLAGHRAEAVAVQGCGPLPLVRGRGYAVRSMFNDEEAPSGAGSTVIREWPVSAATG